MINALINKYAFFSRPFLLLRLLKTPTIAGVTLTMSLVGGLTGCQKQTDNPSTSNQSASNSSATTVASNTVINTQLPTVYATTNVWGSVAKAVGGDKVNVIVGVDDLSQDPHDYQATATDKLNITKSAVMLVNGGGYDDWGMSLAESVSHKPVVINAVALSGLLPNTENAADEPASEQHQHDTQYKIKTADPQPSDHPHVHSEVPSEVHSKVHSHSHGDFNEHVFFSLDTAKKVAEAVNKQLAATSPANQAIYAKNTQQFIQQIDALKVKAKQIGQQKAITAFATEPVIGYLLADMGIKDVTPKAYVVQSETDAGVSVKVLNDSKSLLSNKQVGLLVVNAQTEDATSKQLITLAKASTVPVVAVYETLPDGVTSYTQFIEKTLDDFAAATR